MSAIASTWLGLAILLSAFAWLAKKRLAAISLPFAALIAAGALFVPLGRPIPLMPPAGDYTVVGADIQVDVAIYALLKPAGGQPVFYRLPYSNEQASQLQGAKDASQDGTGIHAVIGEDGGVKYDGSPPVTGEQPKQAEAPAISLP